MPRRRYWKSRHQRNTPGKPFIIGLFVGIPLAAELLARVLVATQVLTLPSPTHTTEQVDITEAYQVEFVTRDGKPYPYSPQGELQATYDPLLGYGLLPNQQGDFWHINAEGFRDSESIPQSKPPGEVRIFVLGGSEAFGELSSSNQATFSLQLQERLNQRVAAQQANPDRFQPPILPYRADQVAEVLALPPQIRPGQYRVINAAVPGYISGNALGQLLYRVSSYDPDIVIMLGGHGDLLIPSQALGAGIPILEKVVVPPANPSLGDRTVQPLQWLRQGVNSLIGRLYLVQLWQNATLKDPASDEPEPVKSLNVMVDPGQGSLASYLATGDELTRRIDRYQQNMVQMVRWTSATQKRLLLVLSPEITGRDPQKMDGSEARIVTDLGQTYTSQIPPAYEQLLKAAQAVASRSANASALNLYALNAAEGSPQAGQALFQGPVSLTDAGQTVLAERLYGAIVSGLAIEPKPFGSQF